MPSVAAAAPARCAAGVLAAAAKPLAATPVTRTVNPADQAETLVR
jgi:hypothetical protein